MKRLRQIRILVVLCVLFASMIGYVLAARVSGATLAATEPQWVAPSVMALKRVSEVTGHQTQPVYLSNLNCNLETYHTPTDSATQTGCFSEASYGQIDVDSTMVIFDGTDEAVPLLPNNPRQILMPWTKAENMVTLDTAPTGGSFINMYKNPLAVMQTVRNIFGQVTAKQLTAAPDIAFRGPTGAPLLINGQSVSFSDNGSWLVIEVLGGSFERVNLGTLERTPFAPTYSRAGSPALDASSVTVSRDGRFVTIENTYASEFKVYDLDHCNGPLCNSYNYWPFVQQHVTGLRYLSHVRFVSAGLISFDVASSIDGQSGTYEIAPTNAIRSLIQYLGLGDSYSAGEGAFDYLAGTDTSTDTCHLSSHSYPLLLTHDLFNAAGGHSVACSGATIHDIGDTDDRYRGQVKGVVDWQQLSQSQPALLASILTNYLPGYVAQQRFVTQYQPEIITLGTGGNDMGFGDILQECIAYHPTLHNGTNTCYATYEDRQELLGSISRLSPRLRSLYGEMKRLSPVSIVYVVGYPQITVDTGSCGLNVHLNASELEFVQELVIELNRAVSNAASDAGVQYVDVSQALAGHRLCEAASSSIAVNGLTAGKDSGVGGIAIFGTESYHPNMLGQQLIEQAVLRQTNNLHNGVTKTIPPKTSPSPVFTNYPKTGRPISQVTKGTTITNKHTRSGQTIPVTVDTKRHGLLPNGHYTAHIDGPGGTVIGQLAGGVGLITIPDAPPGLHTVVITGSDQIDQHVAIVQPIVIDPPSDNQVVHGACPLVADSGVDQDHDGIDDACDPIIGAGPTDTSSGGPTIVTPPAASVTAVITPSNLVGSVAALQPGNGADLQSFSTFRVQSATTLPNVASLQKPAITRTQASPAQLDASASAPLQQIAYVNHPGGPRGRTRQYQRLPVIPWLLWLAIAMLAAAVYRLSQAWLAKRVKQY